MDLKSETVRLNEQKRKTLKQIGKVLDTMFEIIDEISHSSKVLGSCGSCTGCCGNNDNSTQEKGIWIDDLYFLTDHPCYRVPAIAMEFSEYRGLAAKIMYKNCDGTYEKEERPVSNQEIVNKIVESANSLEKVVRNKIRNEEKAQKMLEDLKNLFSNL